MSRATDTTPPDRNERLLDAAQEQLVAELMMSIELAVREERISLSSAEGAVLKVMMRLEAMVMDGMQSEVAAEMGGEEEEEEDVNAFLRRPRGDTDTDA